MKKIIFILAFLPFLTVAQTHIPGGSVSGIWSIYGSPFLIDGDITVDSGKTLVIKPGVRVEFQGHYSLYVLGTIKAIGTPDSMITFTINDTTGFSDPDTTLGAWKDFDVTTYNQDTSFINFVRFSYFGKRTDFYGFFLRGINGYIVFSNNIVENGFYTYDDGDPISAIMPSINTLICNNIIMNNKKSGGIRLPDSTPSLYICNNIICNNQYAFTMQYYETSTAKIYNNTICNNEEVFYCRENCTFTISNSIIYNNTYNGGYTRINCLESDPVFYNLPQGIGPEHSTEGMNLYPQPGSPAIDAGDTAGLPYIPETDLYGRQRIYGSAIDIGALEYQPGVFITEVENNKSKIYPFPNPTTGIFYFNTTEITKTEIYDLNGKLIKTFYNSNTCDISKLKSDVYIAKIYLRDGATLKFQIVKLDS